MIQLRAKAASTSHSLPLPPPFILSHTRPAAIKEHPPLHYSILNVERDRPRMEGAPVSTNTELGRHMTPFETRVRQDTDEIYTRGQDVLRGMADCRRHTVISELLAADYRRQRQLTEALKLVKSLQTQMAELQRQQGPVKGPAQPELPVEAGSSS
ncbi:hypothetical protein Tco_0015948 [Tanacetum coccineum]